MKPRAKPIPRQKTNVRDLAITTIEDLTRERINLLSGLRDLVAYWDRKEQSGWTAADVKRLAEIRDIMK